MDKIQEAIKEGCKDCPKAANEVPCMWGGFVGDCPYNTYKPDPEPPMLAAEGTIGRIFDRLQKVSEPEPGGTISYYKDRLNQQDSSKSFFTPEELRLLIEHAEHLKAEIDRLTAELAELKDELTCEECEQSFSDPDSGVTALCMTCWNTIVTKLRGEIDLLTAENYKMRDGLEIGKSVLVLLDKALAEIKELEAENAKLKENNRFFEDLAIKMEQEIKALKG